MRPRETQVIAILAERGNINRSELAAALGCAPRTAGHYLWMLSRKGKVQADGVGRYARWSVVVEKPAPTLFQRISSVFGLAA